MGYMGVCCASLKDDKGLMKMGLGQVLVGHVNFLLGALVHGAVLRHINLHKEARAMEYAIANVIALVAGLMAVITGIIAIVLSKNKKNTILAWLLLVVSLLAGLLATAATVGLTVAMVKAILHNGQSLLTHCDIPTSISYYSITTECSFDPTRIYGTTIILWVPLILMCVVESVFSGRCCAVCCSFLRLSCRKRRKVTKARRVLVRRPEEMTSGSQVQQHDQEAEPAEQHELLNRNSQSHRSTDWV
ncbi:keratinocyte-associated protein 3-like [Megalops cyprinoides]|uniref:keratinocyte-associated protein 3-like n=1 Tax=Megalops cyprinoides TaxID=118141 RepID=UPI001864FE33|nr:keratinocyte-associated protein 3-like [Megalops cyprinoides]